MPRFSVKEGNELERNGKARLVAGYVGCFVLMRMGNSFPDRFIYFYFLCFFMDEKIEDVLKSVFVRIVAHRESEISTVPVHFVLQHNGYAMSSLGGGFDPSADGLNFST